MLASDQQADWETGIQQTAKLLRIKNKSGQEQRVVNETQTRHEMEE